MGVSPWDRGLMRASLLRASRWKTTDTTKGEREDMNYRRLVGIDLGIASAHTVRVLDGEGNTIAKRKCLADRREPQRDRGAWRLTGCPEGTRSRW